MQLTALLVVFCCHLLSFAVAGDGWHYSRTRRFLRAFEIGGFRLDKLKTLPKADRICLVAGIVSGVTVLLFGAVLLLIVRVLPPDSYFRLVFVAFLFVTAVSVDVAVVFFVYKRASDPLLCVADALRDVSGGRLDTRIPQDANKCIPEIALNFNVLMDFVQDSMNTVNCQYKSIEALAQRYQIAAEYASGVIFDYSIPDGAVTFNDNCVDLFGYVPESVVNAHMVISPEHIHDDDLDSYTEFCKLVTEFPGSHSIEIRVEDKNGRYIWCLIELTSIGEDNGVPTRAVGRISDISFQKSRYQEMAYKAQIDLLTGLYNKLNGKQLINDSLSAESGDSIFAMLVLDIDDFKDINDKFGHLYGDTVIVECADRLRTIFRKSDILCRFGGDEYVVFLKNVPSQTFVLEKAKELVEYLNFNLSHEGKNCHVSLSVGISFFPEHGQNYDQLYEKADQALYYSKRTGKKRSMIYDDEIGQQFCEYASDAYSAATVAKGFSQRSFMDNAVSNVFNVLYETTDLEQSIKYVLNKLANAYHIDVVKLIVPDENENDIKTILDIDFRSDKEQHDTSGIQGGFEALRELFSQSAEYNCCDIGMLPKQQRSVFVKGRTGSCFYVSLPSGTYFLFDTLSQARVWDEDSMLTLSSSAKIIDVFLNDPKHKSGNSISL